nr:MAG TPA: protein of unknown function (DUF5016) [Caudoviricetes sp.]
MQVKKVDRQLLILWKGINIMNKILLLLTLIAILVCSCADDEAMKQCQQVHSYETCHYHLYR